jgi:hypothetical protein
LRSEAELAGNLKSINLNGIARPRSGSNRRAGLEIDYQYKEAREYLEDILGGRSDEFAVAVRGTLGLIRPAFHSLDRRCQISHASQAMLRAAM